MVLLATLFWFALGEGAARFWIHRYGNALDITRPILEVDARLGWKQRSNLDTRFLGLPLQTNSVGWRTHRLESIPDSTENILILGPSSTFGWGVKEEDTYSSYLEIAAREKGKRNVRVINAGEIGFSTFQGLRLLREVTASRLPFKWLVIAYGVNDVDRSRFYFQSLKTDADELENKPSEISIKSQKWLYSSSAVSLLLKFAGWLRSQVLPLSAGPDPVPPLRVPPSEFGANIEKMIELARSQRAKVILVTSANHLPESSAAHGESESLYERGRKLYDQHEYAEAQAVMIRSAQLNPEQNEVYYYLSAIAVKLKRQSEANQFLLKARENEPMRLRRDIWAYNQMIRKIAKEQGVSIVDLDWMMHGNSDDLFVDPIHFSAQGHRGIADQIYQSLELN